MSAERLRTVALPASLFVAAGVALSATLSQVVYNALLDTPEVRELLVRLMTTAIAGG